MMVATIPDAARSSDRRTAVGQEALAVLAEEGMRGLTHRRLDRRLGYPEGSVSVLFRRREDLILAAAKELAHVDFIDFQECFQPAINQIERGEPVDFPLVAQCQYQQWVTFGRPDRRKRVLARFELMLEAQRDAKFRAARLAIMRQMESLVTSVMSAVGAKYPDLVRIEIGNMVRGDMVAHHLSHRRRLDDQISPAYFEERLRHAVETINDLSPSEANQRLMSWIGPAAD